MIQENDVHPESAAESSTQEASRVHYDVARIVLQVLSIGILIGAVVWILRPFLISMIWAGMVVVTTWPLFFRLRTRLKGKRWIAVAVMTLALLLVVVLPLLGAVGAIIQRADDIYAWLKSLAAFTVPQPPEWLETVPLVGHKLAGLWQHIAVLGVKGVGAYLAPYAMKGASWFMTKAGAVGIIVIEFLLMVVISAIFYARGEVVAAGIRNFARRLAGPHGEDVMILAAKAVRGVALGVVVTAIVQATVGGLGLAVSGVPAAALLTAVMFILCLAQIGPALILIPAVIWVYWHDGILWSTILVAFSILAITLDNIVRPFLIRKGADLPLVLILAGVIGGLIAFGIIGLFIGPVILAVAHTLLKAWVSGGVREAKDGEH